MSNIDSSFVRHARKGIPNWTLEQYIGNEITCKNSPTYPSPFFANSPPLYLDSVENIALTSGTSDFQRIPILSEIRCEV